MGGSESAIQAAAKAIPNADFLLITAGAGMSAYSGLPIYSDIANVEAYKKRNFEYIDVCRPSWIRQDPKIFYGFWGNCFNNYRKATPHSGYSILLKWISSFCKTRTQGKSPFFVNTSNVDGHFKRIGFDPENIYEVHGSIERWQCCTPRNCSPPEETWCVPEDFHFDVDLSTMEAAPPQTENQDFQKNNGFVSNHPLCKNCGKPSRPTVYMFGDENCVQNEDQSTRFSVWKADVIDLVNNNNKNLVILEIGCGRKVRRLRDQGEEMLKKLPKGRCTLIRINLSEANVLPEELPPELSSSVICIPSTALKALEEIEAEYVRNQINEFPSK